MLLRRKDDNKNEEQISYGQNLSSLLDRPSKESSADFSRASVQSKASDDMEGLIASVK